MIVQNIRQDADFVKSIVPFDLEERSFPGSILLEGRGLSIEVIDGYVCVKVPSKQFGRNAVLASYYNEEFWREDIAAAIRMGLDVIENKISSAMLIGSGCVPAY